jgi:hypothetical protein
VQTVEQTTDGKFTYGVSEEEDQDEEYLIDDLLKCEPHRTYLSGVNSISTAKKLLMRYYH